VCQWLIDDNEDVAKEVTAAWYERKNNNVLTNDLAEIGAINGK
jgi:hypothetical protein